MSGMILFSDTDQFHELRIEQEINIGMIQQRDQEKQGIKKESKKIVKKENKRKKKYGFLRITSF